MGTRSHARQSCLQILYQVEITHAHPLEAIEDYFFQNASSQEHQEFTTFLVNGVFAHTQDLDAIISRYAKNWEIGRMAVVDKNILRLGIFELFHGQDIPPKVSINEAIELAKKFGDLDSPKFVNGILDSVFRNENTGKAP